MCHLAETSIRKVLDENDNAAHLLAMYNQPPQVDFAPEAGVTHTLGAMSIRIK